jgi:DNA invertase Pin-like site-specific DNA recombinase
MKNNNTYEQVRAAFEAVAQNGYIGDPNGSNAYVYIRVSTEEQSDAKRSGLARQLIHCHEIAQERGYRISWDWIYADDSSGFTFDNRAGLSDLRRAIKSPHRVADAVVIEMLDRLSRNAD